MSTSIRLAPAVGRTLALAAVLALVTSTASAQLRRDDLLRSASAQGALGGDVAASPAELAQRLERLERMLNEKSLSDFVLQLQQLQQEVQDLRGQVEMQQYQLRQLNPGLPQLGQSYAAAKAAAEAAAGEGQAGEEVGQPAAAEGGEAATGEADEQPASEVPVAPPPKTGVGALGGGGDAGGTLALPTPETLEGSEQDAYRQAFDLLKDRDYDAAKKKFAAMLVQYPDGQFADNGVYWLGEIGYVTKDYPAALTHFNRLVTDYPGSPKLPSAMLKLGYIYYDQGDMDQARKMLEAVTQRFPDTTEGRLAQGRLEQMTRDGG